MRPRMYGSTERYSARARNSPSFSAGIGVSISLKFASVGSPVGRDSRTNCRLVAGCCMMLLLGGKHQLDELFGHVRLEALRVALFHPYDVSHDASALAMRIFENLSRTGPRQASPTVGAGILARRIVNVSGLGIHHIRLPNPRRAAE